jgi:hypothetical protein
MLLALLGCSSGASVFSPELTSELPVLTATYSLPLLMPQYLPSGEAVDELVLTNQSHAFLINRLRSKLARPCSKGAQAGEMRNHGRQPHHVLRSWSCDLVEAHYENGVLRPAERLGLRPGERVKLIVMRQPDPGRWDLARSATTGNGDDLTLAEQGLAEWASSLEATERS